ncbi:MAG: c-type cytochrome [Chloroflexi bacterium]|nr:c-type cytochrome [Chloroflexota bacterium]
MKQIAKWIGIILGGLLALLAIAAVSLYFVGGNRLSNAPEVAAVPVAMATDAGAVERGRQWAQVSACTACHGTQLEGMAFTDGAPIGYVPAPNLTTGAGGVGAEYEPADWELAIRHGVNAAGETMVIMPSYHYDSYGDEDLADLIAYLEAMPAVDNEVGERELMFLGQIIFGVFAYNSWAVNVVEHTAVGGPAPAAEVTAEYGAYMVGVSSCGSCHAENLAGNYGQLDSPLGPNLTTLASSWTEEEFVTAVRTGQAPDGRQLSTEMPWQHYAAMSDTQVQALWAYLNTLEPLPDNDGG